MLPGRRGDGVAGSNGLDEILIEELELGVRSYNCLKRAGSPDGRRPGAQVGSELNAIPNFGQKSIEEVIETLHAPRPRPAGETEGEGAEPPCATARSETS